MIWVNIVNRAHVGHGGVKLKKMLFCGNCCPTHPSPKQQATPASYSLHLQYPNDHKWSKLNSSMWKGGFLVSLSRAIWRIELEKLPNPKHPKQNCWRSSPGISGSCCIHSSTGPGVCQEHFTRKHRKGDKIYKKDKSWKVRFSTFQLSTLFHAMQCI